MNFSATPSLDPIKLASGATQLAMFLPVRAEQLAAYTLFAYDWLLTINTERQILLSPGWVPVRLAYFFCRYWPLVLHPVTLWTQVAVSDRKQCEGIFRRPLFITTFNFVAAGCVLLVRLYAFNGSRLRPVLGLAAAMCGVVTFQLYVATTKVILAPFVPACFPTDKDLSTRWLSGYFLAPLLWDMLILLVFVWAAVQQNLNLPIAKRVVRIFVNEGLVYFFAIASVHGINTILVYQSNITISGSLVPMSMLLPNLLACRLVINLRQAADAASQVVHTPRVRKPSTELDIVRGSELSFLPFSNPKVKTSTTLTGTFNIRSWFNHSTILSSSADEMRSAAPPAVRIVPGAREFVHVRKDGNWETFTATATDSRMDSLGVRTDSGTGSFTESSFTGTAFGGSTQSTTSSFTGTAYQSGSDSNHGQYGSPPGFEPQHAQRGTWVPVLRFFNRPRGPRDAPSALSSSAYPSSSHKSSVFTQTASSNSASAPAAPTQRLDREMVEVPITPLRQRLPESDTLTMEPRDRLLTSHTPRGPGYMSAGDHDRSAGYSSTLSPRVFQHLAPIVYPFGGYGNDRGASTSS